MTSPEGRPGPSGHLPPGCRRSGCSTRSGRPTAADEVAEWFRTVAQAQGGEGVEVGVVGVRERAGLERCLRRGPDDSRMELPNGSGRRVVEVGCHPASHRPRQAEQTRARG